MRLVQNSKLLWGCSSVGRALEWHSRGQGFDSPQLHQLKTSGLSWGFLLVKYEQESNSGKGVRLPGLGETRVSPVCPERAKARLCNFSNAKVSPSAPPIKNTSDKNSEVFFLIYKGNLTPTGVGLASYKHSIRIYIRHMILKPQLCLFWHA